MAEKIRVGFVPFGFPSYPTEVMVARAHEAAEAVRALGADVVEVDLLTRVDPSCCGAGAGTARARSLSPWDRRPARPLASARCSTWEPSTPTCTTTRTPQ
jgi:hypothetical protein